MSIVGVEEKIERMPRGSKASSLLICTVQNPVPESCEIANTKANPFQYLGFVVASLGESVAVGDFKGIQYFLKPVAVGGNTRRELRKAVELRHQYPIG